MTRACEIDIDALEVRLSNRTILNGVSARIASGKVTSIIGPNGCGKSTLLRSMARILQPQSGAIRFDGVDIWQSEPAEHARKVAFLSQSPIAPDGLRVRALVERGRTPHLGPFRPFSTADHDAVQRAMEMTGLLELADRRVDRLSGGQRQRAWIAMSLAQDTPVLLLDEPTTYLDLPHQIEVMRLARQLNQQMGITVVMVLHDINLAASHSDEIIAMRAGRILRQGPPEKVVGADLLFELFDIPLTLHRLDETAPPIILPT